MDNEKGYKSIYEDFSCPDCGRYTEKADNIYDAGNGFYQDCAENY